jgi:hypothetical protein
MSMSTLGEFFMAVASGKVPGRQLSEHEACLIRQEFAEAVGPAIEVVRAEQRKAADASQSNQRFSEILAGRYGVEIWTK